MDYAKMIKKLREKLIMSQTEFAELIGVSYPTVCRWETGVHEPTIKIKRKIVEMCKNNNIDMEE